MFDIDLRIAEVLSQRSTMRLPIGSYKYLPNNGHIHDHFVLFVGAVPLDIFSYVQIREFSKRV